MDVYVSRVTREVKSYSRDLYADRSPNGAVQIYRNKTRWESFEFNGATIHVSRNQPQLILNLTHDWSARGKPVEWGLEPIASRIREIDNHRDDTIYDRMIKENARLDEIKQQSKFNEMKAAAADCRREFAKATNDINTSSLEKVDGRRKKDGYL